MPSAAEAELGAMYINAQEAVWIRRVPEEMGHKQPKTPVQTDNSTAEGVVNNKIQPKRTKAMDMRFYCSGTRKQKITSAFIGHQGKQITRIIGPRQLTTRACGLCF
jgi:hypothetical protein